MSNNEDVFVAQDTKSIQIRSVCAFMDNFDYYLGVDSKFYNKNIKPYFKGCEIISFRTAVMLHNRNWKLWQVLRVEPRVFKMDQYTLNKAIASKIVHQAHLQSTKDGSILCQKHLVNFADPMYQYIFLEDSK